VSATRIYRVRDTKNDDSPTRLIEATSAAAAVRFAAAHYSAEIAKVKEVAELMDEGVKVEEAKATAE
jgi:hypothetical protein